LPNREDPPPRVPTEYDAVAKRDEETATIAVAAFNEDVKEEDLEEDLLFCSSPFVFNKSACVSDDDRGGNMMMMSDDNYI